MGDECYNQAVYGSIGYRRRKCKTPTDDKWNGKSQFPFSLKDGDSLKRSTFPTEPKRLGLINKLAEPILVQILSGVPGTDLGSCESVCRAWLHSIKRNILWRNACCKDIEMDALIELTGSENLPNLFRPQFKRLRSPDKFLSPASINMMPVSQTSGKRSRSTLWNDNEAWKYHYATWYSIKRTAASLKHDEAGLDTCTSRFIKNSGNDLNGLNVTASKFWAGHYVITGHCNGDVAVWDVSQYQQTTGLTACAFSPIGPDRSNKRPLSQPTSRVKPHRSAVTDIILYPIQSRGSSRVLRFLTISYDNTMTICTLGATNNPTEYSLDTTYAESIEEPLHSPQSRQPRGVSLVVTKVAGFLSAHSPETVSVWRSLIATDGPNNTIQVWRLTGLSKHNPNFDTVTKVDVLPRVRLLYTMSGHPKRVLYLRLFGSVLTSFSLQGDARVWCLMTGQCVQIVNYGMPFDDAIFYFHLPPYTRLKNFVARGNMFVYLKEGALLISKSGMIHIMRLTGLGQNNEAVAISLWANVLVLALQSSSVVKIFFLNFDPNAEIVRAASGELDHRDMSITDKKKIFHPCQYLNISEYKSVYSYKIASPSDHVQFIEMSGMENNPDYHRKPVDEDTPTHTLLVTTRRKLHAVTFKRHSRPKPVRDPIINFNIAFNRINLIDDGEKNNIKQRINDSLGGDFVSFVRNGTNQLVNRLVNCGRDNTTS